MASTDAGLSSLSLATYSNSTYHSTYFDGALTSYLSLPTNAVWQFGSGNFCLETWAYITSYSSSGTVFFGVWGASNRGWIVSVTSTTINLTWSTTGADFTSIVATTTVALNQWNHFAFVRNGTSGFIYLNGVQVGTGSMSGVTIFNSTGPLYIGANKQDVDSPITNFHMKGYLSNVRIVKGSSVYTSAFNPPTIQLTAIANTALLTCKTNNFTDESVNNFTITRVGNVGFKQFTPLLQANASVTLSPTFSTGTTSYTFNAPANVVAIAVTPTAVDPALASIKYNANVTLTSGQANIASSGPYLNSGFSQRFVSGLLQYANAPQINTQGYSWTAEMYVNPTGNYTTVNHLFAKRVSGTTTTAYNGYLQITSGFISFYNGTSEFVSTTALQANTWSHIAYTYDGSQLSIYVNGNKVYGSVIAITDNTEPLTIGGIRGYTHWMIGNISNFRFVKGYQIYTGNFTPSTSPLALTQSASTGIRAITGAPTSGNSVFFNGSTYLSLSSNSAFAIGTGDYTLEMWLYLPTTPASTICLYNNNSGGYLFIYSPVTGLQTGIAGTGGTNTFPTTLAAVTWYHIAMTRGGGTARCFVNGVETSGSGPDGTNWSQNGAYIGALFNGTQAVTGYISNLRLVKGTALYTSRFTLSAAPLTPVTNTSLLALQTTITADASTNNFTITAVGTPSLSTIYSPFNSASTASTQFLSTALAYQTVQNAFNPSLSLGQGHNNFTAEAWVYLNATPPVAPGWYIMQKGINSTPGLEWSFSVTSTGLYFQTASGIPTGTITSTAFGANIIPGRWMHLALTKVGTSVHVWFNGFYTGTVNGVNNLLYSASVASYVTIANSQTGATTAFNGFISNARVVYGIAAYTPNNNTGFTPSTSPLTTTQSLTSTTAAIGNASSYAVANGSSVYFNNTNDFLTFPEPTNITGDVTIEAWILLGVAPTTRGWIINNSTTGTGHFGVAIEANRTITVFSDTNASAVLTSSRQFPIGIWIHIAVTYTNGIIYVYVNGVLDSTTAVKTTAWGASPVGTVFIGRQASAASQYFPGYITNLRMVYGTAVYRTKFTVPTSPLTAIAGTVFLGLQSSVTLDSSTNNATITRGSGSTGLLLSPMTSPFTTYLPTVTNSGSFGFGWLSGTSPTDFVQVNTGYALGHSLTADFTIETWFYMTVLPASTAVIFDIQSGYGDTGFSWLINNTGFMAAFGNNAGILTGTVQLAINTWYHLAVTRKNGILIFWVNGIQNVSVANTFEYGKTATVVTIGRNPVLSYWSGYLSNVRFINGTAIYTGTFTPSITPYSLTTGSSTNTLAVSGITTYPAVANPTGTTYSGSIYFTGASTTGAIFTPYQGRYDLATFDFTIEAWFYWVNNTISVISIASLNVASGTLSNYAWNLRLNTTNIAFTSYTNSLGAANTEFTFVSSTVSFSVPQWNHVAVVRIGNTVTIYLNGVNIGTGTLTSGQYLNCGDSATTLAIGATTQTTASSYTNNFRGYISNLRVIKGYGVYTGNFTPPTGPLTNSQASGTNIIELNNSIPNLGNSVFFNGTPDYMRAPASTTAMTTGDFTIETYYYPTSFAAVTTLFGQYTAATTALGYWNVQVTTAGIITVYYNGSTNFTANTAIRVNEWFHIALVRVSGTITLYVNGVSFGTVSFATQFGLTSLASPLFIGATQLSGPTQYAVGYMSNLRIVKGVGVYTGAFTVPTSPLSSTQSSGTNIAAITGTSTSLLLYQDSPFTDNSTSNNSITGFGNPQYSPVFSPSFFTYPTPANANSGYFNGTSSFLSLTQPSNASTNDFTIEMWVYPTTTSVLNNSYLLSTSTTATNCYHLWIENSTGAVNLAVDSATASITSSAPLFAKANTWTHIAVTRTSGIIYLFVNGRRQATTLTKATQFGDTGVLNIGRYQPSPGQYFTGYITNVRFVYGTPAVYTGAYSAPNITTPLSAITNTTLLLLQTTLTKDNSTNNVTVTNNNATLSTYTNPYTMMKLPVILTAQYSRDVTSVTGIRDNSMYSATMTSPALLSQNYMAAISPFGITPTFLVGQSALNCDSSINNYPITLFTSATFMPYVTPFNGDAIAFNGTTQYITGTSLLNSLGGDFTIEFFMTSGPQTATVGALILGRNENWSTTTNNNYYIMCSAPGGAGRNAAQTIQIYNSLISATSPVYVGVTPVCDSKWHHIAIVRINNIVKIYVDGSLDPSVQNSFSNNNIWDYSNYTIGSNPSDGGSTVAQLAYNGMLSNIRIINGVGIYTGAFTPPTSNLTTSQSSRTGVVAYTPTTPSSTGNSLVTSSANSGFYINGTFGLNLYLNDYTIEFYHFLTGRPLTVSTTPCFFSNYQTYQTGSISMFAGHSSGDTTKYQIAFNGLGYSTTNWMQSVTSVIYGRWAHIAVVRRSGVTYLYINGILDSTSGTGNYNIISSTGTGSRWYIGSQGGSGTSYLSGYMSNFRVVNGVAVYNGTNTSISNFTVPTSSLSTTQSSGTNIAALSNSLVSNGGAIQIMPSISGGQSIAYSILPPGTYDWTVEGYVFLNSLPTVNTWAAGSMVYFSSGSASVSEGTHCVIGQTELYVAITNVKYGANILHGMSLYTWYHLAYVKISNIIYFYVNGAKLGSATVPTNGTATVSYIGSVTTGTPYALNGYISNLRVTRLLGLYTDTFPNITSTLATTQSSVTAVNAVSSANTSLLALQNSLTADASTNNFILTNTGASLISASSPFNGTRPSVFFNGGDYLSLASTTWPFGPGTFTIEFYIYFLAMPPVSNAIRFLMFGNNGDGNAFYVRFDSTGTVFAGNPQGGYVVINTPANSFTTNTWYHMAVVSVAGQGSIYINGVLRVGPTTMTPPAGGATTLTVGRTIQGVQFEEGTFNGYFTDLRIVRNLPVYTGAFTVPTTSLTLTQGSNTNINAITGTLPSDGFSLNFGGTNYLTLAGNSAFAFGTGDFTIECWFSPTSVTGTLFDTRSGATGINPLLYYTTSQLIYYVNGVAVITSGTTLLVNKTTWYHVALVRIAGVSRMYLNGIQTGSSYTDTNNFTSTNTIFIGRGNDLGNAMTGYISNLRIVKGTGLYSATFAPSFTTPLTAVSGTSLLTGQNSTIIDNSTNAFTITNVSTVTTSSTITPFLSSTFLLMCQGSVSTDISVNKFAISVNGNIVTNTAFSPFNTTTTVAFFNGATHYVVAPSNAAFTFGTGDFTIESYVYLISGTTGTIFDSRTSSNSVHPVLYVLGTVRYKVAGTDVIVGSALGISTWYHVALVRISDSTKLYVNGVQVGSTYTDTNDYLIGSPNFGRGLNGENPLTGYLSNLRVIKGTGAYSNRFPLLTGPLTTSQSSVTPVQAITSPAANANSVFFNGTTDFLTATGGATFNFGTGDWTIECYAYSLSSANFRALFNMYSAGYTILLRYNTNQWEFFRVNGSATYLTLSDANNAVNSWVHHAIVKRSGNIFWYINGTQVYTVANATNYVDTTVVIGGYSGSLWQGFISNFRVVKGVGVYTGNFTVPTSPLTITQSAGTNIAAIASGTLLLSLQNAVTNDASTNNYTLTANGAPALETTVSPFLPSAVMLLTAQSGLAVDNAVGFPITTQAGVAFQRTTTPFGVQTPTALLTLQGNVANVDVSSTNLTSIMVSLANTQTNTVFGPFNSDVPLLTFQDSIIIDNSNNRGQMTVVGAGVAPTDASPFTTTKGFTSLLIPYGYADISYANAFIANNANIASMNSTYNPFTIPSSLVSVLGMQSSNITLESSIYNSTFTTSGTAPTSNAFSPFGTYYANGILTLNTSGTTGIPSNTINYANLLVTAGDGVTTNAYSITVTSLANVGNIGNRTTVEAGDRPTQANANITLLDIGNSQINEATILTFANTSITPALNVIDYGVSVAPSNITFFISDVANSNLSETLSNIFVSNVSAIRIPTDSGLINIAPSNITFFISDVANSNISETIATVTISNVRTTRSIQDTGAQPPPSPIGGTVLFPTYAYTDGITITAANVDSGGGGSSTASNQQVWYQT